jgi:hypothetical protein
MEHVNNDMDELFRKAGELYPLKTSESDWDSVLGKLQDEITGESGSFSDMQKKENQKKRRWLLLIFLVPLGLFSVVYFSNSGNKTKTGPLSDAIKSQQIHDNLQKKNSRKDEPSTAQASNGEKAIQSDKAEIKTDRIKTSGNKEVGVSGKPIPGSLHTTGASMASKNKNRKSAGAGDVVLPAGIAATTNSGNSSGSNTVSKSTDQKISNDPTKKTLSLTAVSSNTNPSVYGISFSSLNSTGVILNTKTASTPSKPKTENKISSKGIYAAVIGGPDLSTVAYQSTTQAGYSLGVLLGYQFNNRIAVETGLLWDKKYYYSNGQHFDKNAAHFPSSVNILNLNGNCNMFEIPLNFRYNFATRINHGFFAEAGFSSYLMKKEYYEYSVSYNGNPPYPHDSTYNKPYNYIFSVFQISAGYEQMIGRNTSIRIEPYLKIPLQGIGIGNMPISSAGLYIGISHSFR